MSARWMDPEPRPPALLENLSPTVTALLVLLSVLLSTAILALLA